MVHGHWLPTALLITLALGVAPVATACPMCESAIGEQVRAGIFNGDFLGRMLAVLLPFPVLLGIVAGI